MILKNGILLNVDFSKINLFDSNIMADKEGVKKKALNEEPKPGSTITSDKQTNTITRTKNVDELTTDQENELKEKELDKLDKMLIKTWNKTIDHYGNLVIYDYKCQTQPWNNVDKFWEIEGDKITLKEKKIKDRTIKGRTIKGRTIPEINLSPSSGIKRLTHKKKLKKGGSKSIQYGGVNVDGVNVEEGDSVKVTKPLKLNDPNKGQTGVIETINVELDDDDPVFTVKFDNNSEADYFVNELEIQQQQPPPPLPKFKKGDEVKIKAGAFDDDHPNIHYDIENDKCKITDVTLVNGMEYIYRIEILEGDLKDDNAAIKEDDLTGAQAVVVPPIPSIPPPPPPPIPAVATATAPGAAPAQAQAQAQATQAPAQAQAGSQPNIIPNVTVLKTSQQVTAENEAARLVTQAHAQATQAPAPESVEFTKKQNKKLFNMMFHEGGKTIYYLLDRLRQLYASDETIDQYKVEMAQFKEGVRNNILGPLAVTEDLNFNDIPTNWETIDSLSYFNNALQLATNSDAETQTVDTATFIYILLNFLYKSRNLMPLLTKKIKNTEIKKLYETYFTDYNNARVATFKSLYNKIFTLEYKTAQEIIESIIGQTTDRLNMPLFEFKNTILRHAYGGNLEGIPGEITSYADDVSTFYEDVSSNKQPIKMINIGRFLEKLPELVIINTIENAIKNIGEVTSYTDIFSSNMPYHEFMIILICILGKRAIPPGAKMKGNYGCDIVITEYMNNLINQCQGAEWGRINGSMFYGAIKNEMIMWKKKGKGGDLVEVELRGWFTGLYDETEVDIDIKEFKKNHLSKGTVKNSNILHCFMKDSINSDKVNMNMNIYKNHVAAYFITVSISDFEKPNIDYSMVNLEGFWIRIGKLMDTSKISTDILDIIKSHINDNPPGQATAVNILDDVIYNPANVGNLKLYSVNSINLTEDLTKAYGAPNVAEMILQSNIWDELESTCKQINEKLDECPFVYWNNLVGGENGWGDGTIPVKLKERIDECISGSSPNEKINLEKLQNDLRLYLNLPGSWLLDKAKGNPLPLPLFLPKAYYNACAARGPLKTFGFSLLTLFAGAFDIIGAIVGTFVGLVYTVFYKLLYKEVLPIIRPALSAAKEGLGEAAAAAKEELTEVVTKVSEIFLTYKDFNAEIQDLTDEATISLGKSSYKIAESHHLVIISILKENDAIMNAKIATLSLVTGSLIGAGIGVFAKTSVATMMVKAVTIVPTGSITLLALMSAYTEGKLGFKRNKLLNDIKKNMETYMDDTTTLGKKDNLIMSNDNYINELDYLISCYICEHNLSKNKIKYIYGPTDINLSYLEFDDEGKTPARTNNFSDLYDKPIYSNILIKEADYGDHHYIYKRLYDIAIEGDTEEDIPTKLKLKEMYKICKRLDNQDAHTTEKLNEANDELEKMRIILKKPTVKVKTYKKPFYYSSINYDDGYDSVSKKKRDSSPPTHTLVFLRDNNAFQEVTDDERKELITYLYNNTNTLMYDYKKASGGDGNGVMGTNTEKRDGISKKRERIEWYRSLMKKNASKTFKSLGVATAAGGTTISTIISNLTLGTVFTGAAKFAAVGALVYIVTTGLYAFYLWNKKKSFKKTIKKIKKSMKDTLTYKQSSEIEDIMKQWNLDYTPTYKKEKKIDMIINRSLEWLETMIRTIDKNINFVDKFFSYIRITNIYDFFKKAVKWIVSLTPGAAAIYGLSYLLSPGAISAAAAVTAAATGFTFLTLGATGAVIMKRDRINKMINDMTKDDVSSRRRILMKLAAVSGIPLINLLPFGLAGLLGTAGSVFSYIFIAAIISASIAALIKQTNVKDAKLWNVLNDIHDPEYAHIALSSNKYFRIRYFDQEGDTAENKEKIKKLNDKLYDSNRNIKYEDKFDEWFEGGTEDIRTQTKKVRNDFIVRYLRMCQGFSKNKKPIFNNVNSDLAEIFNTDEETVEKIKTKLQTDNQSNELYVFLQDEKGTEDGTYTSIENYKEKIIEKLRDKIKGEINSTSRKKEKLELEKLRRLDQVPTKVDDEVTKYMDTYNRQKDSLKREYNERISKLKVKPVKSKALILQNIEKVETEVDNFTQHFINEVREFYDIQELKQEDIEKHNAFLSFITDAFEGNYDGAVQKLMLYAKAEPTELARLKADARTNGRPYPEGFEFKMTTTEIDRLKDVLDTLPEGEGATTENQNSENLKTAKKMIQDLWVSKQNERPKTNDTYNKRCPTKAPRFKLTDNKDSVIELATKLNITGAGDLTKLNNYGGGEDKTREALNIIGSKINEFLGVMVPPTPIDTIPSDDTEFDKYIEKINEGLKTACPPTNLILPESNDNIKQAGYHLFLYYYCVSKRIDEKRMKLIEELNAYYKNNPSIIQKKINLFTYGFFKKWKIEEFYNVFKSKEVKIKGNTLENLRTIKDKGRESQYKIVSKGRSEPSLEKLDAAIKYLNDKKNKEDELKKERKKIKELEDAEKKKQKDMDDEEKNKRKAEKKAQKEKEREERRKKILEDRKEHRPSEEDKKKEVEQVKEIKDELKKEKDLVKKKPEEAEGILTRLYNFFTKQDKDITSKSYIPDEKSAKGLIKISRSELKELREVEKKLTDQIKGDKLSNYHYKEYLNKQVSSKLNEIEHRNRNLTSNEQLSKSRIDYLNDQLDIAAKAKLKELNEKERIMESKLMREKHELDTIKDTYIDKLNKQFNHEYKRLHRAYDYRLRKKNHLLLDLVKNYKGNNVYVKELLEKLKKQTEIPIMVKSRTIRKRGYKHDKKHNDRSVRKIKRGEKGEKGEKGNKGDKGALKTHKKNKIKHPEDGVYSLLDFISN